MDAAYRVAEGGLEGVELHASADAIALVGIQPPFAAAINLQFVPRSQYGQRHLQANDAIELIAPITGG